MYGNRYNIVIKTAVGSLECLFIVPAAKFSRTSIRFAILNLIQVSFNLANWSVLRKTLGDFVATHLAADAGYDTILLHSNYRVTNQI